MISKLYVAHQEGEKNVGFDIEGEGAAVKDVAAAGIWDLFLAKYWGLKLATNAATTVLRVDLVSEHYEEAIVNKVLIVCVSRIMLCLFSLIPLPI